MNYCERKLYDFPLFSVIGLAEQVGEYFLGGSSPLPISFPNIRATHPLIIRNVRVSVTYPFIIHNIWVTGGV